MNNVTKLLVAGLVVALLTTVACSGLTRSDKPATRTWWLEPYTSTAKHLSSDPVVAVEISVSVVPGLDTDRILTLSNEAELNQFTAARWADNLPELVASLTGRALQASGRYDVLPSHGGGGRNGCDLHLEVREFFASIGSTGQATGVRVAVAGHYQCHSDEPVPIHLNASIPVHADHMSAIIAAFQQGMDRVMVELLALLER